MRTVSPLGHLAPYLPSPLHPASHTARVKCWSEREGQETGGKEADKGSMGMVRIGKGEREREREERAKEGTCMSGVHYGARVASERREGTRAGCRWPFSSGSGVGAPCYCYCYLERGGWLLKSSFSFN